MSEHIPATDTAHDDAPERVPMGTLVFGLVLVVLGLLLLAGLLYGFSLDPALVAIGFAVGAGLILVVGGLVAGRRARH